MNHETHFPVLSGAEQEKRNQERRMEMSKKEEPFLQRMLKGGKKIALPAIASLIALGSVIEAEAQSTSENLKRTPSLDQIRSAKIGDTVSFQENDSTVHMFKKVNQRNDGTFKIKDLGTIKTTKGDAVKVADLDTQAPATAPSVKDGKENDGVNFKNLPGYMENGRYQIKYGDKILSFDTPQHAAEAQTKLKVSPVLNNKTGEKLNNNLNNIDPTTLTGYSKDGIWGFEYKGKILKFDTVDHMRQAAKSLNLSLK